VRAPNAAEPLSYGIEKKDRTKKESSMASTKPLSRANQSENESNKIRPVTVFFGYVVDCTDG